MTNTFIPSPEQQAILDYVAAHKGDNGRKALAVKARAGTGKTSTILELIRRNPDIKGIYVAFNKDIVTEVEPKLEGTNVQAKTFHGLALGSLISHIKKTHRIYPPDNFVEASKYRAIIQQHIEQRPYIAALFSDAAEGWEDVTPADVQKMWVKRFDQLIHYLRVQLVEWDDREKIEWLIHDYSLQDPELSEDLMQEMVELTPSVMRDGEQQLTTDFIMDFDDMIYWAVRWDIKVWWNYWVFVDEAQDLSPMQRAMVNKILYHKNGFIVIVGDDQQAIYRFSGADSDSFDRTVNWFKADVLPMTTTRRCDKIITHHAQQLVGDFVTLDSKERGKIVWLDEDQFAEYAKPGDMVICRVKAPLIGKAIELLKLNIPAVILGGNIGAALVELLEKISHRDDFSWDDPLKAVESYRWSRINYWKDRDEEAMADSVNDDCDALTALIENSEPQNLDDFERYVNNLFSDTSRGEVVTLCTGHKSKGLQAERVFLLAPEKMPLSYLGMHPEDVQQEKNLYYVAMTRAKHTLVYLTNATFLEPYQEGSKIRPTYIQYDFGDYEWTPDLLVRKEDAPDNYEPQRVAGLLAEPAGEQDAMPEPDIVEGEIIDDEMPVEADPEPIDADYEFDPDEYDPLDNRHAAAHAALRRTIRALLNQVDPRNHQGHRELLEAAERNGKDFQVALSQTQVTFPYEEMKAVYGEENAQIIQWNGVRDRTYNLLEGKSIFRKTLDHAIQVFKAMSKPAEDNVETDPVTAAIEEKPLSAAEAADIGFAPVDTDEPIHSDGLPAHIPGIKDKVLLNLDTAHDEGAHHRAIALARDLFSDGLWDGETPIRFDNAYETHTRVYGPDSLAISNLVIEEKDGELYVSLPIDEDAVPTDSPDPAPDSEETAATVGSVQDTRPQPTTPPEDDPRAWAQWFFDHKDSVVILDTETTDMIDWGNAKQKIEMVQIAIIDLDGNTILKEYIRPMRADLKPGAAAVHGITEAVLDQNNALSFIFHEDAIRKAIDGKHVIAYNSDFDANVILRVYQLFDKEPPTVAGWHCAMKMYAKHNPNKVHRGRKGGWWKLTEAIEQQRLTPDENAHDALADVLMTLALLKSMAADPDYRWTNQLGVMPGDLLKVKASGNVVEALGTTERGLIKAAERTSGWRNSFEAREVELHTEEAKPAPEAESPADEKPGEPETTATPARTSDPHQRIEALIRSFESPDKAREFVALLNDVIDTWQAEIEPVSSI